MYIIQRLKQQLKARDQIIPPAQIEYRFSFTGNQLRAVQGAGIGIYGERPHESLGNLPPAIYREKLENSNLELSQ